MEKGNARRTEILKPDRAGIERAAEAIRRGEIVGMPTETVYGLAADAWNEEAVLSIFRAKGRPADNPLIVHIDGFDMLGTLASSVPDAARRLMEAYWPGPMTLILPKNPALPDAVTAGLDTVGIRMPSNETARALIRASGRPLAAPSANTSGKPSPTTARHVYDDMNGKIPYILDGGPCAVGLESTVIDTSGKTPVVLRPGAVTPEMIAAAAGSVEIDRHVMSPLSEGTVVRSPGMKYRHYAPEAAITVFEGEAAPVEAEIRRRYDASAAAGGKPAILAFGREAYGARRVLSLGDRADPETAAARLFAALREMDAEGVTEAYSEALEPAGIGLAFMNRLGRAASFHIVHLESGRKENEP